MQEKEAACGLSCGGEPAQRQGEDAASQSRDSADSELMRHRERLFLPSILLVEDDLTLATLEAGVLTAHGFTVDIVNSGERAIAILHQSLPDLVVLDIELTGLIQGWEVLEALRAIAAIPVLLTTSSTSAVRERIRSLGETRLTLDHLPKPYPMQTLLKRVKRMLMVATQ
ncbi:MAG TPA: response regulator [Ktedonobacteraceae bacterium]|jgi:DNA-binding response OmpR family regulator